MDEINGPITISRVRYMYLLEQFLGEVIICLSLASCGLCHNFRIQFALGKCDVSIYVGNCI